MYVCMYVCMYVWYICMYVWYVCVVCMYGMYVCTYVCMYGMYLWYVCVYVCMCACTSVCLCKGHIAFVNLLQNFIQHPSLKVNSICEGNYRDHQCGFRRNRSTIDHVFCIRQILEKKWEYNEEVHQLFIGFKKAYDSVRREVLYKILIEFGIPKKLVRLIKMSLTETYSRVRVGNNVSDRFPISNGLRQGDALSPLLFNFALEYAIRRVQVKGWLETKWYTSASGLCR